MTFNNGRLWAAYDASRDASRGASRGVKIRTLVELLTIRKANEPSEIFDAITISPNRCFRIQIPRDLFKLASIFGTVHGRLIYP